VITGTEALSRCKHPLWELLLPTRFVPSAQPCGLKAADLQLEIRESALMGEAELRAGILSQLSALGVRLAVAADEFGRDYSSLSQLMQFPLRVLKIDPSFVRQLDSPGDARTIVSALLAMGNNLKQRLVAEG
jgi:EAL domain-containing protein (putative c-di-GMP-specific phosphodiesterase class I)